MNPSFPPLRLLACVGLAFLLASCAPTITGPHLGRIVNSQTGAEGTLSLERGSLRPFIANPFAPDNATVEIGGLVYRGRTQVVGHTDNDWGLSVGLSSSSRPPMLTGRDPLRSSSPFTDWGARVDRPRVAENATYRGNLIVRTAAPNVRTLTCDLLIDQREHGIGECTGNDGVRYALQF